MPSRKSKRNAKGQFTGTLSGRTITEKGYVRLTAGPYRNWYEHRAITAESIKIFCPPPLLALLNPDTGLPDCFHVHHSDWNRQHNCPSNLLLLQNIIHNALTLDRINRERMANAKSLVMMLLGYEEDPMPGEELPDWVLDTTVYPDELCGDLPDMYIRE